MVKLYTTVCPFHSATAKQLATPSMRGAGSHRSSKSHPFLSWHPIDIRTAESLQCFHRRLKTHLMKSTEEHTVYLSQRVILQWVQYGTCTKEALMEKMVLEQYLKVQYPEAKAWVREHYRLLQRLETQDCSVRTSSVSPLIRFQLQLQTHCSSCHFVRRR
uniref:SCAN box domain-containing protein n=1 Tax=Scophthalmus maximus TaxID=52904 RepID=A0A8D3CQ00_SCOMX